MKDARRSLLQLASGALFGGIGIPLQYYGYKAISDIVAMGGNTKSNRLIDIGATIPFSAQLLTHYSLV